MFKFVSFLLLGLIYKKRQQVNIIAIKIFWLNDREIVVTWGSSQLHDIIGSESALGSILQIYSIIIWWQTVSASDQNEIKP